jgi:two-component system, OmpR family, manganese sensing sensor histidine kinase
MRSSDLEKFQAIASASNQMAHLTDDLLMLARSDEPSREQRWEVVNLRQLLQQLMKNYQPQATAKQISFTSSLSESLLVKGNASQLHHLYGNLLENAINYTTSPGTVSIVANIQHSSVVVTVNNSGIGIASAQLPHIFDRFWRADSARCAASSGENSGD